MNVKRFVLGLICFISVLTPINGAQALGTSPWTKVLEIIQGPGGYPLVRLENPGDAGTGCAKSSPHVRFKDVDHSEAGKRHFATILSALLSGKEVRIKTAECSGDYPYIESVYIRY
ncbi:hypothetical protein JCM14469_06350 [Desulfatiferula olefinivorans]